MNNSRKRFSSSLVTLILLNALLLAGCVKNQTPLSTLSGNTPGASKTTASPSLTPTYTLLLNADYENDSLNSGITNLEATSSTASDAAYMIAPGVTDNYGIAHKVVLGDSGYFSDNNWRSESATAQVTAGKYYPGDERRYEFSVLLKDWTSFTTGMSEAGDIIFQAKLGGGGNPAWYFMTKRNTIAFRAPNAPLQQTIIPDYRSYINQWMNFRVDVLWANTATGYVKIYAKLPGDTDYSLKWQISNFQTWNPDNPNATTGYMKWGLYRPGESLANGDVQTRIIYHDNIRIYQITP